MNQILSAILHNPDTFVLLIAGMPIFLTRLGSRAFAALLQGQGSPVTYREIHTAMHGTNAAGDDVARVKQAIKRIRRRIDEKAPGLGNELIVNHSSVGYRLNPDAILPLLKQ